MLTFKAELDEGWHIYSRFIKDGGPVPTTFIFVESGDYSRIGTVKEESPVIRRYNDVFFMDLSWFEREAVFTQQIKVNASATVVRGEVAFMACTDTQCLLPEVKPFSFEIELQDSAKDEENKSAAKEQVKDSGSENQNLKIPDQRLKVESSDTINNPAFHKPFTEAPGPDSMYYDINDETGITESNRSFLAIFLAGLAGGIAAIFMPCIFPMLPLTIGYFAKRGGSRRRSIGIGLLYGLSIMVIYVSLGLCVSLFFGSGALNALATNGVFNMFFFLLLVSFGVSFLGAFELTLPSSWINKANTQAEKNGFTGIFFMATTLTLVSFSCTGPLIGTLLVETAATGNLIDPAIGMFGFSFALALPFSVFAMFPSWLRSLPKSGGWLNDLKVVLGFLELALALKFLSNVDLAYHWNLLGRDVFLVLWIVIFTLLGLHLLGKLDFTGESSVKKISPLRVIFAITTLAFALYMLPGLLGAPLKAISAFLPPMHTQDFNLHMSQDKAGVQQSRKYADLFKAPSGLDVFFDYDEGLHYARQIKKPVLLDFTGHACVNCRKMETTVWTDQYVFNLIQNEFVLIQLYVDDKTELPPEEHYRSASRGKVIHTIGGKWSDFQASVFKTNSQPYYVIVDPMSEKALTPAVGAEYDLEIYRTFLRTGLRIYKQNLRN